MIPQKEEKLPIELCIRCKGKGLCGRPCPILARFREAMPKIKQEFSGASPPEVFVGRYGYPRVFTGILSPNEFKDTEQMSYPESWIKNNTQILDILEFRGKLIYSRFKTRIKGKRENQKLNEIMQLTAMASKPLSMHFKLKKKPSQRVNFDIFYPIIGNPAPLIKAETEENAKVEKKVDYLINDIDVKSVVAMQELYKARIRISNIIKILSAGLLGIKKDRKLVPTRWAITATDDTLSKNLLKRVKLFPIINDFLVFHETYLGNHYEILMLPENFSFEVIEAKFPGSLWNPTGKSFFIMKDYESFFGRKTYAKEVTGGYYAVKLPIAEFLSRIKRQASVLILREVLPEYFAPLGVGILRETVRKSLDKPAQRFSTLDEALTTIKERLKLPLQTFTKNSKLLKENKEQLKLREFV